MGDYISDAMDAESTEHSTRFDLFTENESTADSFGKWLSVMAGLFGVATLAYMVVYPHGRPGFDGVPKNAVWDPATKRWVWSATDGTCTGAWSHWD